MVLVVGLWIQYARSFIAFVPEQTTTASTEHHTFAAVFSAGLGVLKEKVAGIVGGIRQNFGSERHITIENPNRNFTVDGLDPIPKTPLP